MFPKMGVVGGPGGIPAGRDPMRSKRHKALANRTREETTRANDTAMVVDFRIGGKQSTSEWLLPGLFFHYVDFLYSSKASCWRKDG